jgi:hypothetical protein
VVWHVINDFNSIFTQSVPKFMRPLPSGVVTEDYAVFAVFVNVREDLHPSLSV